jgi:hypothetical protein
MPFQVGHKKDPRSGVKLGQKLKPRFARTVQQVLKAKKYDLISELVDALPQLPLAQRVKVQLELLPYLDIKKKGLEITGSLETTPNVNVPQIVIELPANGFERLTDSEGYAAEYISDMNKSAILPPANQVLLDELHNMTYTTSNLTSESESLIEPRVKTKSFEETHDMNDSWEENGVTWYKIIGEYDDDGEALYETR